MSPDDCQCRSGDTCCLARPVGVGSGSSTGEEVPETHLPVTEVVMSTTVQTATDIRPFQVDIADEALEDLRRRVEATQWPEKETVADSSQGVPLAPMQELA